MEEEKFLEAIKKRKPLELQCELDLLVKVYNEQLEQLVRLGIDIEIFDYLVLAEPQDNQHAQNRVKTMSALKKKRKLIGIVRKQIVERVKGINGKKD